MKCIKAILSIVLLLQFTSLVHAQDTYDPDDRYAEARKLIMDGKRVEGRKILSTTLEKYPNYGDLLILMGRSYAWDGKYDSAAIYFERALITSPKYEDAYVAYIDNLLWAEDFDRAEEVIALGLERIGPHSSKLAFRESRYHYYNEDYRTALKLANDLFKKEPKMEGLLAYIQNLQRLASINAIGATYDHDSFEGALTPWHTYSVYGRTRTELTGSLIARVTHSERFEGRGTQFELDAFPSLGKNSYGYFNVGFSQAFFFPQVRFGGSIFWNLPKAFEIDGGYRYLRFSETTHILTGSIGKYISNWWLNFRYNNIPGVTGSSSSFNFQSRYYFSGPEDFFSLQLSTGVSPDEENRDFQSQLLNSYRARLGYQHLWSARWMGFGFVGYSRDEIRRDLFRSNLNISIGTEFRF